jgi:hypothetical protein
MDKENRIAAEELACEMHWGEALKFLRAEIGVGLREAGYWIERLANENQGSELGKSFLEHKRQMALAESSVVTKQPTANG